MASLLIKRGHTVKLLEKTGRLGGKSHTIVDECGVPHEMGTCYLHQGYGEIRDLVRVSERVFRAAVVYSEEPLKILRTLHLAWVLFLVVFVFIRGVKLHDEFTKLTAEGLTVPLL